MPKGIRPTQNKVRKALFDILCADIKDGTFLDLFAGSGAVGWEALSWGAKQVVSVENNRVSLSVLKQNLERFIIESPDYSHKVSILGMDAFKAIEFLFKQNKQFDIIFLDPPYYQNLGNKILKKLNDYVILNLNGLVVIQHFKKDLLPKEAGFLRLIRQKEYGDTALSFYKRAIHLI